MPKLASIALLCIFVLKLVQAVPQGRILGGRDAMEGQFPHQVSLQMNARHMCGGSIISRSYVLTAAHCVGDQDENGVFQANNPKLFSILAGTVNLSRGGVMRLVDSIKIHDGFDIENDIALLKLSTPLDYSRNIQAIALASAELVEYSSVTISGWGSLQNGGNTPLQLQWSVFASISASECFEGINYFSDKLICLAHGENNGACSGDSGGPGVYNGELVAIAGFIVFKCGTVYPDGYTKVYYYVDWIKEHSDL